MGDVHPLGNPHYSLDPGLAPAVTANIVEGLVRVAPEYRRCSSAIGPSSSGAGSGPLRGWSATLAPFKGAPVVVNHTQWAYLLTRFGRIQVGTIEERPGIPPTPGHPAKLIQLMKEDKVKLSS